MQYLWKKKEETDEVPTEYAGCMFDETEMKLLIRLARNISTKKLREIGFNQHEIDIILGWGM